MRRRRTAGKIVRGKQNGGGQDDDHEPGPKGPDSPARFNGGSVVQPRFENFEDLTESKDKT